MIRLFYLLIITMTLSGGEVTGEWVIPDVASPVTPISTATPVPLPSPIRKLLMRSMMVLQV